MSRYLGIDVGATTTRAVLGDETGTILASRTRDTGGSSGSAVVRDLLDLMREVCAEVALDPGEIEAAGIGSIGPIDTAAGAVLDPPNLPVDRLPLVAPIEREVESQVSLCNDATAAAVGERYYRTADVSNLVYLTVSTGIGAGAIVDESPVLGSTGNAVEAGHFVLEPDGPPLCGCGGRGHWEGYAGGANLAAYARFVAQHSAVETGLDLDGLDPETLYEADDPLAESVRTRVAGWHAQGVATLVHAFDPELVAIGGTIALEHPDHVIEAVRERLPTLVTDSPPAIEQTALGPDAGTKGALACALTGGSGPDTA